MSKHSCSSSCHYDTPPSPIEIHRPRTGGDGDPLVPPTSMTSEEIDAHPVVRRVRLWRWINYCLIALALILLDQISKTIIFNLFYLGERLEILPIFDLTLVFNQGAAFGFLADHNGWQRWFFSIFGLGVSAILLYWLYKPHTPKLLSWAYCLILAGAVGNIIDRITNGYVIDFILVYWNNHNFPVFNIADCYICIGVGLLLLQELLTRKKNHD